MFANTQKKGKGRVWARRDRENENKRTKENPVIDKELNREQLLVGLPSIEIQSAVELWEKGVGRENSNHTQYQQ